MLQLQLGSEDIQTISVAVPSRLKATASTSRPLSGWRVAVKEIFKIEGIKTSVCNRAYYELYPPAPQTAACVKLVQQKGACVIGTTKLAAFAATEEPIECVDYQAPWNPRADGYQSPAGSSSGSGVAIASYPWLDIAIGSDSKVLTLTRESYLSRLTKGSEWKWSKTRSLEWMFCPSAFSWTASSRGLHSKLRVSSAYPFLAGCSS